MPEFQRKFYDTNQSGYDSLDAVKHDFDSFSQCSQEFGLCDFKKAWIRNLFYLMFSDS